MKKILVSLVLLTVLLSAAACAAASPGGNAPKGLEGSLESILERVYQDENFSDDFKEYSIPGLITSPITAENCEYHLGKAGLEFAEAIASEHQMSTSAYALCLVRAKDGQDIEKLKTDIRDNVNPMKWICVGVDPSNVIVDNIGDVVILIMSNTDAQNLQNAFLALKD